MTTEYRILLADNPDGKFQVFQKRVRGLEYSISHYGADFYIMTNKDKAFNFKLMKTSELATAKENWVDVIPHDEEVLLEEIDIFKDFLVVSERSNGLNKIRIMPWSGKGAYFLPFESETYTAYTATNVDFDTDILRYSYQSMATPSSVIDFNMKTKTKEIKKEQQVLGGNFDKNNYTEERVWATAKDGTQVPISIVYRKGLKMNGNNPFLLYAYGSYGASMDAYFSSVFKWLKNCENIFGFNLEGYSMTRIYAFLAERYLAYWFNKYAKPLTWPIFFYDTNKNKIYI